MKQRHIAALLAEALGTAVLVLVVLNVSRYGLPFFTAIAAGVTVATFVSAFGKISGGHFNPAVTLGLFSIRQVGLVKTIGYLTAQALAAFGALQLYQWFAGTSMKNATTPFDEKIFIAEALGAFILSLGIGAVVTQKLKNWQAAATIGSSLFLGATVAGLAGSGFINPAVALGARSLDINYLLGPIVGFVIGSLLFAYLLWPIFSKKTVSATVKASAVAAKPEAVKPEAAKSESVKKPAAKKVVAKKAPAKKPVAKKTAKK